MTKLISIAEFCKLHGITPSLIWLIKSRNRGGEFPMSLKRISNVAFYNQEQLSAWYKSTGHKKRQYQPQTSYFDNSKFDNKLAFGFITAKPIEDELTMHTLAEKYRRKKGATITVSTKEIDTYTPPVQFLPAAVSHYFEAYL